MKHIKYLIEYMFLFALDALCFWFFGSYFYALLGIGMLVFAGVAVALPHLLQNKIRVVITAPVEGIEKNQEVPFIIEISNSSFWGLVNAILEVEVGNGFAEDLVKTTMTVPIPAHGSTQIQYPVCSRYAGSMDVKVTGVVFYDLLYLHDVRRELEAECRVYSMPRGDKEANWALNDFEMGMDEAEESNCKGNDFSDVSQIREYIPGDSIRDIHWKLSAKKEDIMVKDRLRMSSQKMRIVFMLQRLDVEQVDQALEYLASVGYFLIDNQIPVTLYFWSEKYQEIREKVADQTESWKEILMQVIYERAGVVGEEQWMSLFPEQSYLLVDESGAKMC